MNKVFVAGAALGAMLAAGVAVAQSPPPGAPPPPPGEMRGPQGGPEGEMRGPHGGMGMMRAMHDMHHRDSKAAHFRFRKGDAMVDIKCADNEPMKACVDAGSALLDKLATK